MQPAYFSRPQNGEHAPGFAKYIALTPEGDVPAFLAKQLTEIEHLLAGMDEAEALTIHAPYGWTIKQVVGHMTDVERVFGYRMLRLGRLDATPLPGFEENAYMAVAPFNAVAIGELVEGFSLLRQSNLLLCRQIPAQAWMFAGHVSGHAMTSRAMLYALAGHAKHHLEILHKRLGR